MCGIAGIISTDKNNVFQERLKAMTDIIAHRGPDGEGHWISENGNVGLGHRRLSIIDLSHAADQPMHYLNRYSIVFNGEIYNYLELKDDLIKQGYSFTTSSDTEVLMALYDKHKEDCLQLLDGMFSFVMYDAHTKEVFIARDRFGEKPFFYSYESGSHFLFGSEMKCLWAGGIKKEVNNRMLFNYLTHGYLENPNDLSETFYLNCTRLPHGHFIKFSSTDLKLTIKQYYSIDWQRTDNNITVENAAERFHELFYTSVKRRLRSDVTVGSSLSGGLDSSLVVAVIDNLKKGTQQKQDTFSAVFPGFIKDERRYMDHVIARTNVSPHFTIPTDEGMLGVLDKLCWHQEEPFGSASIYVQYCVMQLAKENNVTVLLDGQGADEVLAGYHGYYLEYFKELKRKDKKLYVSEVAAYTKMHEKSLVNVNLRGSLKDRVKFAIGNQIPAVRKIYHDLKGISSNFLSEDFHAAYKNTSFKAQDNFAGLNERLEHSTYRHGLQELLRYADRNSMAHSREVRLPFLYHELVEFLFTLPSNMKINDGWTKWIMRKTFEKELPAEICWRTDKIGYEPPQKDWMENKVIKEKIYGAKECMVGSGILNSSALGKSVTAEASGENKGNNWRNLMVGEMIK